MIKSYQTLQESNCKCESHIMQHEIRLASFNVRNLALPSLIYYETMPPYSTAEYDMKTTWIANQLDQSNADVIGFQEIFSPDALPTILAKTQHYKNAYCITVEPASGPLPKSPNVALISRLRIIGAPVFHTHLPDNLKVQLPGDNTTLSHFSRPVLEASVLFPGEKKVNIFVAHLKSKRPDYPENTDHTMPMMFDLGCLRSLIRRGTDALGIRHLVSRRHHEKREPLILMGDMNDSTLADSTQILSGDMHYKDNHVPARLYNAYEIQPGISHEEKTSPFIKGTDILRIDHVFVSEEFAAASGFKAGRVSKVTHFNSHLGRDRPEISDHGLLMASLLVN